MAEQVEIYWAAIQRDLEAIGERIRQAARDMGKAYVSFLQSPDGQRFVAALTRLNGGLPAKPESTAGPAPSDDLKAQIERDALELFVTFGPLGPATVSSFATRIAALAIREERQRLEDALVKSEGCLSPTLGVLVTIGALPGHD